LQQTISDEIIINGIGLHSGAPSVLVLRPAPANSGITFQRSDIISSVGTKAIYSNVADTKNCTCLADSQGNIISTIEHLMAALFILEIDNVHIDVSSPEIPIMDGSAQVFLDEIQKVGTLRQNTPRRHIKILKEIDFSDDKGNYIKLSPCDSFCVDFTIDFPSAIVGRQSFSAPIDKDIFCREISPCRTFCEKYQIDYLRSIGLIKGGNLNNAVVLDGENILNPEGFKVKNECVNHKVLDAIGDMYTAGMPIIGKLTAFKTGHYHNNQILAKLFANKSNYQII